MYGQGGYTPQFTQGPPFPPGPPHPYQQQQPPGPPPPVYQHALPPPPPPPSGAAPMSVNMGQPYMHPAPPAYAQVGPPYHAPQQIAPPRMLPPPPMPPPQGQAIFRTPPPPPPGIHHVPAPPPPPPSSFASITPAPFPSFVHPPAGDAHPPSGPPPSPPPLPPSPPPPPPPAPPLDTFPDDPCTEPSDKPPSSNALTPVDGSAPSGDIGSITGKGPLVEGEESGDLPPQEPSQEVVRKIDSLCHFIAEVGPEFESLARTKEAGNPEFAFLFGGEAGSAAAIGHEYFQWMKKKYLSQVKSHELRDQTSLLLQKDSPPQTEICEDEGLAASPAKSDMDMEDDIVPEGDSGHDNLSKELIQDANIDNKVNSVNEPLHATQNAEEVHLEAVVSVSGAESTSGFLLPVQNDDKHSPIIEDVSPVRCAPDFAHHISKGMHKPVGTSTGDSTPVEHSHAVTGGRTVESPRVYVKDRSSFRLIEGYASDGSDEDNENENTEDIIPVRESPTAASGIDNASLTEVGPEVLASSSNLVPLTDSNEVVSFAGSSAQDTTTSVVKCSTPADLSDGKLMDDKMETSELPQDNKTDETESNVFEQEGNCNLEEDIKRDSAIPDVDEFGRLVRKGSSDSDSDGMHCNERRGKRGRSLSRSQSPQENKWRRRSRSPQRRHKRSHSPSWSPMAGSRSKSPPAFRRTNAFSRRERDQPPECFNFVRGRCFRGAACKFLHRDYSRQQNRQQQYQEYPQSANHGVQDNASVSENCYIDKTVATELGEEGGTNIPQLEEKSSDMEHSKELPETNAMIGSSGVSDEKDVSVLKDALENAVSELPVPAQVSQEEISSKQELQQVEKMTVTSVVDKMDEEIIHHLTESSQPLQAGGLQTQPIPAEGIRTLHDETLDRQPNYLEGTPLQPSQPGSSINLEQGVDVTQPAHAEGHIPHPLPSEEIQLTTFQNQPQQAQTNLVLPPVTRPYPSQSPNQPYTNYGPVSHPHEQSLPPAEFKPSSLPTSIVNYQPPQMVLPAPQGHPQSPFPPNNSGRPFSSQHARDNLPPVASHQPQFPPSHTFTSQHGPHITDNYDSQRFTAPNPRWSNLPPPPPPNLNALPSRPPLPPMEPPFSQFTQSALPPRGDFNPQLTMRHVPPADHNRSQGIDYRAPFHHQPPLHIDDSRRMQMPVGNQHDQSFARGQQFLRPPVPDSQFNLDSQRDSHLHHQPFLREQTRTPLPGSGFNSSPFDQGGSMHSQSLPFRGDQFSNKARMFSEDHFPPRNFPREQFPPIHDLPHRAPYGPLRYPEGNTFPSNFTTGMADSISRYPSSTGGNSLPLHLSNIGIAPISIHHNPYASTFEQPPASLKLTPNVSARENDTNYSSRFDSSFNPGIVPVDGPAPRITASPPNSRRPDEKSLMPKQGVFPRGTPEPRPDAPKESARNSADAYDPLFDSIEQPSIPLKKPDTVKENPVIDVECNTQKEGVTAEPKSEADEFGEIATDAEVGAVENGSPLPDDGKEWSPGVPLDVGNTIAGDVEINQGRSPGKSKKTKDSRSMKLFKLALADFVKEVLKPSWRQGNMSKEAFKTIVKKTVDKVSGAMPSHQIPKNQAKINQYVESSQRKLTKLVMGYVDKYVKV